MEWRIPKHRKSEGASDVLHDKEMAGLLGPGVEAEGTMKISSGAFHLHSHFKGHLSSEGSIIVGENGEIEADIEARWITILGKVKGTVRASEALEIKQHGVVLGEISTPVLIVEPGGYFHGQCHIPTPEPAREPEPHRNSPEPR